VKALANSRKPLSAGNKWTEMMQSAYALWNTSRSRKARNVLGHVLHYVVVLSLSFVFLYPLLYIVSQSLMQPVDLSDASVVWIPKTFSFSNFAVANEIMNFWNSFRNSVILSLGGGLLQVIGCAIAGYGFARYRVPGYHLWMVILLCTFLVPPQTMVVPLYLQFTQMGWTETYLPILVPAIFGHGLRGALFVLVFIQFFKGMPQQLEEAARIDGAGAYRTFYSIIMPLARPAILVVFLFSFVWHWNDLFETNLYILHNEYETLSQTLVSMNPSDINKFDEGIRVGGSLGGVPPIGPGLMAGALLTILPILLLYLFAQRYFVESIERTGITGE